MRVKPAKVTLNTQIQKTEQSRMSTKYKIVTRSFSDGLEESVKNAMADGWTLQGGVSICNGYWAQAMVKREPLPPGTIIPNWQGGYVQHATQPPQVHLPGEPLSPRTAHM